MLGSAARPARRDAEPPGSRSPGRPTRGRARRRRLRRDRRGGRRDDELRRLHFVAGVSIRDLQRRTGLGRNTIRRALRAERPPGYVRRVGASKLDPFKPEIQRLLREDPRLPGIRIFELIAELGFRRGKTVVYEYVAELRPLFAPRPRTFQRTIYRRGELRRHLCRWAGQDSNLRATDYEFRENPRRDHPPCARPAGRSGDPRRPLLRRCRVRASGSVRRSR